MNKFYIITQALDINSEKTKLRHIYKKRMVVYTRRWQGDKHKHWIHEPKYGGVKLVKLGS